MPVENTKLNRAESARRNGAKSHGPKSAAGKRISSQNGLKLGMYSSRVVLKNESQELYDQLRDLYIERWQPVDAFEFELVETMVNCRWRLRRLESIETTNMDLASSDHINLDPNIQQALAYRTLGGSTISPEQISRHEERLHRQFHRACRTLTATRAKASSPKKPGPLTRLVATIVALFSSLLSFNFHPSRPDDSPQFTPTTLLEILDERPDLRAALLEAIHQTRESL
jgi:hypothetical protein